MIEAYTRGLLQDIRPNDGPGLVREQLILSELSRQRDVTWFSSASVVKHIDNLFLPFSSADSAALKQEYKTAKSIDEWLLNSVCPWIKPSGYKASNGAFNPATASPEELKEYLDNAWKARFGDPNNPEEVQRRIKEIHTGQKQ